MHILSVKNVMEAFWHMIYKLFLHSNYLTMSHGFIISHAYISTHNEKRLNVSCLLYNIDLIFSRIKNTKFSKNYPTNMSCAPTIYPSTNYLLNQKRERKKSSWRCPILFHLQLNPKIIRYMLLQFILGMISFQLEKVSFSKIQVG